MRKIRDHFKKIIKLLHSPSPASVTVFFFFLNELVVFLQLITEQASFTLPRSAEIEGKCGSMESEIHISWKNKAYTLRIYFAKVGDLRQLDIYFFKHFLWGNTTIIMQSM